MNNFLQKGYSVDLPAPYAVKSGEGMLVGALFAVASKDALVDEVIAGATKGVFALKALNTAAATFGEKAYWDNTARQVTDVATDNTLIGCFIEPKTSGQLVAAIRLNGIVT